MSAPARPGKAAPSWPRDLRSDGLGPEISATIPNGAADCSARCRVLSSARPGCKRYRLEVLRKNAWRPVGRARLTNDSGVFIRTIRVKRGTLFRIWSPSQRRFSQQLRIR